MLRDEHVKRADLFYASGAPHVDYLLLAVIAVLVLLGSLMVFSASFAYAEYRYGDSYYFIGRQIIWVIVSGTIMMGAAKIDPVSIVISPSRFTALSSRFFSRYWSSVVSVTVHNVGFLWVPLPFNRPKLPRPLWYSFSLATTRFSAPARWKYGQNPVCWFGAHSSRLPSSVVLRACHAAKAPVRHYHPRFYRLVGHVRFRHLPALPRLLHGCMHGRSYLSRAIYRLYQATNHHVAQPGTLPARRRVADSPRIDGDRIRGILRARIRQQPPEILLCLRARQ